MNLFIYGDESGVFDNKHNDVFVFGGLIFLDKSSRDNENRKFISAERKIAGKYTANGAPFELKACKISNKHKAGLFRSTNGLIRYAFIVDQQRVNENIFCNKKSKQRYLDYVYKVGLKTVLGRLISGGALRAEDVDNVYVRFDEHTTATDGRYELREGIEDEFKYGTYNFSYNTFHRPIFPSMRGNVYLEFKDSRNDALIRASDIIANHAYYHAVTGKGHELGGKLLVVRFP